MITSQNYRIVNVQRITLNGRRVLAFTAFKRQGDAFIHVGQFTAPARTASRDLWTFVP